MRKINESATRSFLSGEQFKGANTTVDGNILRLHGNLIAIDHGTELEITTAGWNTNTTLSRLNSLPGVKVVKKAGKLFLNGEPWDGKNIRVKIELLNL